MPSYRLQTDAIRAIAAEHGDTSNRQISARTGLHETTLCHLLRGNRAPSLEVAFTLAEAYGIPVDNIVRRADSAA